MEIKIKYFLYIAIFCSLLNKVFPQISVKSAPDLSAATSPQQEEIAPAQSYNIKTDADGEQYIEQTLSWPKVEHIREYEIILEKKDETGQYFTLQQIKTSDNFLTVRLESGQYRYSVIIYNLLGKKAYQTPFTEFNILKALKPQINSVSPTLIYLDEPHDGTFSVKGLNLLPESVFILMRLANKEQLSPLSYQPDERHRNADIIFDEQMFDTGDYVLKVTNPGGFTSEIPLLIKFIKWYDLTISAGYSPLFILADETILTYFNTRMSFIGGDFRITFIPLKRRFGYVGVSANLLYHRMAARMNTFNINMNILQTYINAVYQYPIIKGRLVIDIHGGAGFVFMQNLTFIYPHDIVSDPFTSFYFAANVGFSLQVYMWKRLYLEVKADYTYMPMKDMFLMTVQPSITLGWQF